MKLHKILLLLILLVPYLFSDDWVSPTSHENSEWNDPENAYDGNVDTDATSSTNNRSFELIISSISCNKVRIYSGKVAGGEAVLDVEVYYSGAFHMIHTGTLTEGDWEEISVGSTEDITKARITMGGPINTYVGEFEFWSIAGGDSVSGSARHGGSLEFDGAGDYVNCGNDNSLVFGDGLNDDSLSISMWVKTHIVVGDVASAGIFHSINGMAYLLHFHLGNIRLKCYDFSALADIGRGYNFVVNVNQWYHIMGTYNGDGTCAGIKLYLDGIRTDNQNVQTGTYTAMEDNNVDFYIGTTANHILDFDGLVADVQVYRRELGITEIQWLHRHPGAIYDTTDLEGYWKLNEFTGAVVGDSSSNTNDGTISNATWNIDTPVTVGKSPVTW